MTLQSFHLPEARHAERLTEQRNPNSMAIDRASVAEALAIIRNEDRRCIEVAEQVSPQVEAAIERVVTAFRRGGRLFYAGSGTSGRLGVLDASEQPPTFGVPATMVVGIVSGGYEALYKSIEGAEDEPDLGAAAIVENDISDRDVVFGIASGGRTPFVLGALAEARRRGAATIFLSCTPPLSGEENLADVQIHALVGPEVITGSTRMKAGTITKMILNQVTTVAMIQYGKVYENLMVDVQPSNTKLVDRAGRILSELTGLDKPAALDLLERSGNDVKTALVMQLGAVDRAAAQALLADSEGHVARAIRSLRPTA